MLSRRAVLGAALALATTAAGVAAALDGATVARLPLVARIVHVNVVGDRYRLRVGDRLYADGRVLLGPTGGRLGAASFACRVTGVRDRYGGTCTATLRLPLGELTGRWPLEPSSSRRTRPLTGGSGAYRGVRGRFVLGATRPNGDTPFGVELTR